MPEVIPGLTFKTDPVCWHWPTPETITFKDERAAREFLQWWNRECAVCGDLGRGLTPALVEDHDHETGLIRGYLCRRCNSSEWCSDSDLFRKYRDRTPASILGLRLLYTGGWGPAITVPGHDASAGARDIVDKLSLPSRDEISRRRRT
jgi:hypothetical protein